MTKVVVDPDVIAGKTPRVHCMRLFDRMLVSAGRPGTQLEIASELVTRQAARYAESCDPVRTARGCRGAINPGSWARCSTNRCREPAQRGSTPRRARRTVRPEPRIREEAR